jgi:hypothetical protein
VIIPFFIYFEGAIYPYAMESPVDPDHLPDFSGGVRHHFLPEDLIISSQPSEFLQDMAADSTHNRGWQCEQKKKNALTKSKGKVNNKGKAKKEVEVKLQENPKAPSRAKSKEKFEAKSSDAVMCSEHNNNYQKRAEEAEAALADLVGFIQTVLGASNDELKKLCSEKEIKIAGKSAMKHKYACALLVGYVNK